MSVSYHSYLVAGVRLSDIFRIGTVEREVTRYDETTGKPYQKKVSAKQFFLFGKEIPEPGEAYPSEWPQLKGIDVVSTDVETLKDDSIIVGRLIAQADPEDRRDCGPIQAVAPCSVSEAVAEMRAFLYQQGYEREPEVFLVADCSC